MAGLSQPAFRLTVALFIIAVLGFAGLWRLDVSYDLSVFLPAPEGRIEQVLADRLGEGPGARSIFIELTKTDYADASELASRLRSVPGVASVLPQEIEFSTQQIPRYIWLNRFLLADLPESEEEWRQVLTDRAVDLMFLPDEAAIGVVSADPALSALSILEEGLSGAGLPQFDQGQTQYLLLEADVSAFDPGAQQSLIDGVRSLVDSAGGRLYGAPVYAVDLQQTVRFEATFFSILASLALLLLIIWRYRSVIAVIAVAVPLVTGFCAGMVVLSFVFASTHGITLAFGFTLLGVAIDYPLHLLTHGQVTGSSDATRVWRIMRVGIVSTLIAYATFLFAGSEGLQQLGLFAFSGILAASVAAAWLGTSQHPTLRESPNDGVSLVPSVNSHQLRFLPGTLVLLVTAALLSQFPIFNDNLGSLTPISPEILAQDANIRRQLDVADMRYIVATQGEDLESTLQHTEIVSQALAELADADGPLSGWQSVADFLPSQKTQALRLSGLSNPEMRLAWQEAVRQSSLLPQAFAPFEEAWADAIETNRAVGLDDLRQDPLLSQIANNLLIESDQGWTSLVWLFGLQDPEQLKTVLPSHAQLVDLQQTSQSMVSRYRTDLLRVLFLSIVLITVMLIVVYDLRRAFWLVLNMLAAVASGALVAGFFGGLSLFDVMALALVAGLGLDYLLFSSAQFQGAGERAVRQAVNLCAASSLIVFGVLSLSSIPVLRGIGSTVFFGVCVAFALTRYAKTED